MARTFNDAQIAEFKEAFSLSDRSGEGKVPSSQVGTLMRSLGRHPTNYELKQILKGLPEKVDFQTFLSLMGRQLFVNEAEAELVDSFKTFDPSNSGHISVQDLRKFLTSFAEKLSDDEVIKFVQLADPSNSGKVNYAEFARVLLTQA